MQITWKASESASALHATHAMAAGYTLAAPGAGEALAPLVESPPAAAHGDLARLTAMLLEQAAAGVEQNHVLAKTALTKLRGRAGVHEAEVSSLAAWISSVERAYYDWHRSRSGRQLVDEIVTRTAPVRDQWEARGPGMLRAIERLAQWDLLAERAEVVMVLPVLGGHGMAHLPTNQVTFEAVLTNADPQLPEIVRLAWLLGQLQFDLPAIADHVEAGRLPHLARVAMLPPALAAAEQVELAEFNEASLAHAAMLWRVASSDADARRIAQIAWQWWTIYEAGQFDWPVGVKALEQMLVS